MEDDFPYAESARRKARKEKMLEEGKAAEESLLKRARQRLQAAGARPARGGSAAAVRSGASSAASRPGAAAPRGAAGRPGAALVRPGAAAAPRPAVRAGAALAPRPAVRAGAAAAAPRVRPRKAPVPCAAGTLPPPRLKASAERLLLESQQMDLFGTGQKAKVCVCPECHHELVKIVCLGKEVRVCFECRGVWFPCAVVREFARDNEWFRELEPAIQLHLMKRSKP